MTREMFISHLQLPLTEEELVAERIIKENYLADNILLEANNKKLMEDNEELYNEKVYLTDENTKAKENNKIFFGIGAGLGAVVTTGIVIFINSLVL